MQAAEYLHTTTKELSKPRNKAMKDLKELGMFTANAKSLLNRIPGMKMTDTCEYVLPLEDGGTTVTHSSRISYFPAAALARLSIEVRVMENVAAESVEVNEPSEKEAGSERNVLEDITVFENQEFGRVRVVVLYPQGN